MDFAKNCDLVNAYRALRTWLATHAYEVWWSRGADHARGGFHERLHLDATPTDEPRRARLHPRQVFAYAHASELGWSGPADRAIEHGLQFFLSRYKRWDGCYRAKVAADGTLVDDHIELYDQAFAILGFAAAYSFLREERWLAEAGALQTRLQQKFRRTSGGFEESVPAKLPLLSNSHMHLLEAALAWLDLDADPRWLTLATQIVELALTRFINPRTGAIGEYFTSDWQPLDTHDEIVEPGHQFEWASLLFKFARHSIDARLAPAALRLIAFGESRGVDRQRRVVINRCFADGRPGDSDARLWPQTERIRASCAAAEASGEAIHVFRALEATQTLMRYFATPLQGLWRDRLNAANEFVEEPAPASSLYHIVGAALALGRVCNLQ